MKKAISLYTFLVCIACILNTACVKPLDENGKTSNGNGKYTVTFKAFNVEQMPFGNSSEAASRATSDVKTLCSRMSIAIFNDEDMSKVASVNKTNTDTGFGKFAVKLNEGTYHIVIIAHNGEGNATITSPSKITFKENKVTDTFYAYKTITVDKTESHDITLKRAVAKFKLVVNDKTPENIHFLKFYYTGGSSTFDATSGYGCVNSKQTEWRAIVESAHSGESYYEIYTFPHQNDGNLKIDVSAHESKELQSLYSMTFEDVNIKRNVVTQYSGIFYKEDPSGGRGVDIDFNINIDGTWSNEDGYNNEY